MCNLPSLQVAIIQPGWKGEALDKFVFGLVISFCIQSHNIRDFINEDSQLLCSKSIKLSRDEFGVETNPPYPIHT